MNEWRKRVRLKRIRLQLALAAEKGQTFISRELIIDEMRRAGALPNRVGRST